MKFLALCGYPAQGSAVAGGGIAGLKSPGILAQSAVPSSVTGTTVATSLASIPIPAGTLGKNGSLRVRLRWTVTNSANPKTLTSKIGGVSVLSFSTTTTTSWLDEFDITNRNSMTSQLGRPAASNAVFGTSSIVNSTFSIDFSQAQSLNITGTLANAAESITLEMYRVEILNS